MLNLALVPLYLLFFATQYAYGQLPPPPAPTAKTAPAVTIPKLPSPAINPPYAPPPPPVSSPPPKAATPPPAVVAPPKAPSPPVAVPPTPSPPKVSPTPAPYYGPGPLVKQGAECVPLCEKRCSVHSRKRVCVRACSTCCLRCKCVPPGTYGNKQVCGRCYTDMTTHGGRLKCP